MKRIGMVVIAVLFIFLSGCRSDQTFKNDDGKMLIGFISESMTVERWQRDRDAFVAKAEKQGAQVIVKNAYEDSERQIELCKEMIDQGVDVLAIVAYDKDSLKDMVKYAHNNNVKVIAYDRMIDNAGADFYISFDSNKVGKYMGEAAIKSVPNGNYVILNGKKEDNNSFMLNDGYMDVLKPGVDNGNIKVVGEIWVEDWRDELAYNYVSELLEQGISMDVIIAADDRLAEGAVNALSENRLAGTVLVTGQDAELAACQRIVQGTQSMTVYKPIRVLAEGAADVAVKIASGEEIADIAAKIAIGEGISKVGLISDGTYEVESILYDPISVDKDNINITVIGDGFYAVEQVYANLPQSDWPK
jgi:D-xylose transport system substrate-binding protein